jgi:hypothetical protein
VWRSHDEFAIAFQRDLRTRIDVEKRQSLRGWSLQTRTSVAAIIMHWPTRAGTGGLEGLQCASEPITAHQPHSLPNLSLHTTRSVPPQADQVSILYGCTKCPDPRMIRGGPVEALGQLLPVGSRKSQSAVRYV